MKIKKKNTFHSVALSRMSCMLSLKTVAKRKKKKNQILHIFAGITALQKNQLKKKISQALQQANFTMIFTILILYPWGGVPVASLGWGLLCCTYIPMCLCESLSFLGEGGGRFFFQILFLKRNKCIHLFVKTPLLFVQLLYINDTKKKKQLWKKTTVCNGIAEYAAHVFYLVILALRILDDIS